ncbi:unnamed protein product [Orchesella dallaii]|uniref:Protein sleepless n=1 Tax=Orchesella dallaii TaxID=48710 RepID=A0ABP1S147_9HEXA
MMRARNLLLMVLFGLFLVDLNIESVHGLFKCYYCSYPCWQKPGSMKEKNCSETDELKQDRCITIIKREGVSARACRDKATEDEAKAKNLRCDEFSADGEKHCYCHTELCNGMDNTTMSSTTGRGGGAGGSGAGNLGGYSQFQLLLGVVATAIGCRLFRLLKS